MKELQPKTAIHGEAQAGRSAKVRKRISELKKSIVSDGWELVEQLDELLDRHYYREEGYDNFDTYIDEGDFEFKSREVRYRIRILRLSRDLGISRSELRLVAISKLKEVFRLDPEKNADDIKRLFVVAKSASLEHIKEEVRKLLGGDDRPEMTFRNFYVVREVATKIDEAIEVAKLEAGTAEDSEGNEADISDGRALEFICEEWLQDPNRAAARMNMELQIEDDDLQVEDET